MCPVAGAVASATSTGVVRADRCRRPFGPDRIGADIRRAPGAPSVRLPVGGSQSADPRTARSGRREREGEPGRRLTAGGETSAATRRRRRRCRLFRDVVDSEPGADHEGAARASSGPDGSASARRACASPLIASRVRPIKLRRCGGFADRHRPQRVDPAVAGSTLDTGPGAELRLAARCAESREAPSREAGFSSCGPRRFSGSGCDHHERRRTPR